MLACKKYMNFTTYYNKTSNVVAIDFISLLTRGLCLKVRMHNTIYDIVLYTTREGNLCIGSEKGSPTSSIFFSKIYCVLVKNTRKVNLFDTTNNSIWYTIVLPSYESAIIFESKYNTCVNDYENYSTTNKINTQYTKLE